MIDFATTVIVHVQTWYSNGRGPVWLFSNLQCANRYPLVHVQCFLDVSLSVLFNTEAPPSSGIVITRVDVSTFELIGVRERVPALAALCEEG